MKSIFYKLSGFLLISMLFVTPFTGARSAGDFDSMMANAYTSFRSAYWYTKTGNPGIAALEMMMFDQQWSTIRETYGNTPPVDYASDTGWQGTLNAVAKANAEALELVNAGQVKEAHKTVTQIRDQLAELRKRNGITAFSDYVNAYGKIIDVISPLRVWEYELKDDDWVFMEAKAGEMAEALDTIGDRTSDALKDNAAFQKTLQDNKDAVSRFVEHLENRFERGAKGSIRDIRSAFGLLFLKYG